MIKITVTSTPIREMKGIGKTSNKPYHMRIQTAYAHTVDKDGVHADFPEKFELVLEENQTPYERGEYTLAAPSFYVSREGRLALSPRLVALKKPT